MRQSKAQSAMEFLMIFILFTGALTVTAWSSLQRTNEISAARTRLEVNSILDDISGKINTAFLEGSGFSIRLNLPESIMGSDYSVQVHRNSIYIDFQGNTYIRNLLTQNITGSLAKGGNRIRNQGGLILIENM